MQTDRMGDAIGNRGDPQRAGFDHRPLVCPPVAPATESSCQTPADSRAYRGCGAKSGWGCTHWKAPPCHGAHRGVHYDAFNAAFGNLLQINDLPANPTQGPEVPTTVPIPNSGQEQVEPGGGELSKTTARKCLAGRPDDRARGELSPGLATAKKKNDRQPGGSIPSHLIHVLPHPAPAVAAVSRRAKKSDL